MQLKLVEDVLEANPDIHYIVGTSPTAEAAVGLLKDRGLKDKIKVLAYYFTPPVYQGIKDGTILAAPTDSAVIQGRIAIDQVVRILEGKHYVKHVGPGALCHRQQERERFRQGLLAGAGRLQADLQRGVGQRGAGNSRIDRDRECSTCGCGRNA